MVSELEQKPHYCDTPFTTSFSFLLLLLKGTASGCFVSLLILATSLGTYFLCIGSLDITFQNFPADVHSMASAVQNLCLKNGLTDWVLE